jgi:hypothetical protein
MVYVVYAAIGVAILAVLLCAGLYLRHNRSRAVISTTEWVRLMRKNDIQYDRTTNAKGRDCKPKPPKIPPVGEGSA